jgi:hypothetical protein
MAEIVPGLYLASFKGIPEDPGFVVNCTKNLPSCTPEDA